MRTINFIEDQNKRINIAMETIEIFSPLAQRLGMKEWQDELEDLSFQTINPEARKTVIDRLNYLNSKDENLVDEIRYELKKNFLKEDLNCNIDGRIKSAYSIWNKIKNKNISFEQLSDIMAFRVITNSTRECYKCLGIIHRKYQYIPGRFKDFISAPKSNKSFCISEIIFFRDDLALVFKIPSIEFSSSTVPYAFILILSLNTRLPDTSPVLPLSPALV